MRNSAITRKEVLKKTIALGLTLITAISAVACISKSNDEAKKPEEKVYTYNTYVMKGQDPMDTVRQYTEIGLVDVQLKEDGTWEWCYEMAESITDVTSTYADKEKWGIDAETTGRVWEIKLNQKATFEEGTPITADTYLQSMEALLSGDDDVMKLYTDVEEYDTALLGAYKYSLNDMAGQTTYHTLSDKGYSSVEQALAEGAVAQQVMIDVYGAFGIECDTASGLINYQDDTVELIDVKGALGTIGAKVTAKQLYDQLFAKGAIYEQYVADYVYIPAGNPYEEVSFDTVGLIKVDDYTMYYITAKSVSEFAIFQAMRTNWISYDTEGKDNVYVSYGPYKLLAYRDKEVKLTKNTKWYGYTDDKHNGQFQTTDVVIKVLSTQAESIQMYESGQLDYMKLSKGNMAPYIESPYRHVQETPYVYRWTFATDLDALIALEVAEGQGNNKRVLYYDSFRKAMSLAIDNHQIAQLEGINYNGANYLINVSYYTDMAHDQESVYRNQAVDVLGPVSDIEGAKALFQSVYEQAVLNRNYTDGQQIQINCIVGDYETLTEEDVAQEKALNEMLAAATEGTGFQGKIKIVFQCKNIDRYRACANGQIEMIKSAWGGDVYDPFTLISCYTDPEYVGVVHEGCGWDPATEKVTITYDFDGDGTEDTVAKSFTQWTRDIQVGGVYGNDMSARAHILSRLEQGIIDAYQCIPWATETEWSLSSEKVKYGADSYNPMYEYGGVRHMTYNYDDKEWKNHQTNK